MAERKVEDLEVDKETRDKKTSELNNTVLRLETEVHPETFILVSVVALSF